MLARNIGLWVGTILIAPAVAALIVKLVFPQRKMLVSGRAIVFLLMTMALGPGLLVNVVLKDHWGRPRPIDVAQFGGTEQFVSWWDPRGDCPSNCSFVSGDVAGAFWTMAPAALAPPQWRVLAYGAALALGAGMAVMRVMAGAHFVTDSIFAGVFTFLIIWLMYGVDLSLAAHAAATSDRGASSAPGSPAAIALDWFGYACKQIAGPRGRRRR